MTNETKPKLRLSGEDGNVYSILGRAKRAAQKAGWTKDQWQAVFTEASSGDYDHVLQTLMRAFDVE